MATLSARRGYHILAWTVKPLRRGWHRVTHGLYGIPEYRAWAAMKSRCSNPKHPRWKYYGARGITVCERWRESFSAFLADMGRRPSPKHCLDRTDNDGNYEPRNCRWVTWVEQNRNRRPFAGQKRKTLVVNGEAVTVRAIQAARREATAQQITGASNETTAPRAPDRIAAEITMAAHHREVL